MIVTITTSAVNGKAVAQYSHCPNAMFLTSDVFMPKMPETKESGKKIMVTTVKMTTALFLQSSMSAACAIAFERSQQRLIWSFKAIVRPGGVIYLFKQLRSHAFERFELSSCVDHVFDSLC